MKMQTSHVKTPVAREIMTQGPQTLAPGTLVPVAMQQILSRRITELPIVDSQGKYRGVFSEKCCMRVLASLNEWIATPAIAPMNAGEVMVSREKLFTLGPEEDVFDAMSSLLARGFSGAPVVDSHGKFIGVFSEKTCLSFIAEAAYNKIPSARVHNFTDPDSNRLIDMNTDVRSIAKIFIESKFDRLPVVCADTVVGQVSRRDLLDSSNVLATVLECRLGQPTTQGEASLPIAETFRVAYGRLSEHTVSAFADLNTRTIEPDIDLFSVAQLFFESPFRCFSVLEADKLIGQVSRSDVIRHAIAILK
ncbi:CBS domain-containing protein [Bremerella cremea]|uniref:CBS domain-containing protein n=1 Tax=Bremerella cremea TaxID=1031537 RepID=UPI0031E6C227